jgi:hypothetical protein
MVTLRQHLNFTLILLLCFAGQVNAQEEVAMESAKEYKNIFGFVPQYAIYHGIRFDYERQLNANGSWLVLAPQLFSDRSGGYYYDLDDYGAYETLIGVGLNAYYKVQVYKSDLINNRSLIPRHMLYFSFGPSFQYFKLTNTEEIAKPFIADGITYYSFSLEEVEKPITRIGAIANAGWQLTFDRFVLDLYLGLQIKYALDNEGKIIDDIYAEWIDPSYSGVMLDGGIKIGFFF